MVTIKKLDLEKSSIGVLSPLQTEILEILWRKDGQRVRHIYGRLKPRGIALTSIAVDLDRLYKKGMVTRTVGVGRGGPPYIYSLNKTKEEFHRSLVEGTVDKLIDKFGSVAVDYFNERFSKEKR